MPNLLDNYKSKSDKIFHWMKLNPDAVPPFKVGINEIGFDLTLIKLSHTIHNTKFYSTGIATRPPQGYYLELVPRSSISKTGHMMAHSVGIIDPTYRGEIFVPLIKVDNYMPDLTLPIRLVQLVPRRIVEDAYFVESEIDQNETERGIKGLGSTGVI